MQDHTILVFCFFRTISKSKKADLARKTLLSGSVVICAKMLHVTQSVMENISSHLGVSSSQFLAKSANFMNFAMFSSNCDEFSSNFLNFAKISSNCAELTAKCDFLASICAQTFSSRDD